MDFFPKYDSNSKLTATDYHRELVSRHPQYRPEYLFMFDLDVFVRAHRKKDKKTIREWGPFNKNTVKQRKLPSAYAYEKNLEKWFTSCKKAFLKRWKIPFDLRAPFPWRPDDSIFEGKDISDDGIRSRVSEKNKVVPYNIIRVPAEFEGKYRKAFLKEIEASVMKGSGFLIACFPRCTKDDLKKIKLRNEWSTMEGLSARYPGKKKRPEIFRYLEVYDFIMHHEDLTKLNRVNSQMVARIIRDGPSGAYIDDPDGTKKLKRVDLIFNKQKLFKSLAKTLFPKDDVYAATDKVKKSYQRAVELIVAAGPSKNRDTK